MKGLWSGKCGSMRGEGSLGDATGAEGGGSASGVLGGATEHPGEVELQVDELEWFLPIDVPGDDPKDDIDTDEELST